MARQKSSFWKWVINAVLGCVLAAAFLFFATFSPNIDLMARLIHVDSDIRSVDVIVVPSIASVSDCHLHAGLMNREILGSVLFRHGYSRSGKIIFTGHYVDDFSPSQAGVQACVTSLSGILGLPAGALMIDNQAHSTYQNAVDAKKIMQTHDWQSALLVTTNSHAKRAMLTFQRQGIRVYPALTPDLPFYRSNGKWFDINRVAYLHQFLYEYVALLAYKCYGYI